MTLREALSVLLRDESAGDWVYAVRDRAAERLDGFTGNTWEHPRVKKFSEAITTLQEELDRLDRDDRVLGAAVEAMSRPRRSEELITLDCGCQQTGGGRCPYHGCL